jgi:NAD(P)-dependent dehydrogenase (short-subunit alcohol dehydrogenase family)
MGDARTLLRRGAAVAVLDLPEQVSKRADVFPSWVKSDRLICLEADVTERRSLDAALEQVVNSLGLPDGLITCAAIDSPPNAFAADNPPFEEYSLSAWRRVMDVNVTGVFLCCQVFGGAMAQAGRGCIINISSIYGLVSPDQRVYEFRRQRGEVFNKPIAYSVSKSAILNLTRYLATYWADQGVRVNTLTLGGVFNGQEAAFVEAYSTRVPLGRLARADEYDAAMLYLISESSSYVTGSNLVLDGGWTAW